MNKLLHWWFYLSCNYSAIFNWTTVKVRKRMNNIFAPFYVHVNSHLCLGLNVSPCVLLNCSCNVAGVCDMYIIFLSLNLIIYLTNDHASYVIAMICYVHIHSHSWWVSIPDFLSPWWTRLIATGLNYEWFSQMRLFCMGFSSCNWFSFLPVMQCIVYLDHLWK